MDPYQQGRVPFRDCDNDDEEEQDYFDKYVRPFYKTRNQEEDAVNRALLEKHVNSLLAEPPSRFPSIAKTGGSSADKTEHYPHPLWKIWDESATRGAVDVRISEATQSGAFWKKRGAGAPFPHMKHVDWMEYFKRAARQGSSAAGDGDVSEPSAMVDEQIFCPHLLPGSLSEYADPPYIYRYLDKSVPRELIPAIVDSVEFHQLVCDMALLVAKETPFDTVPEDLSRHLYTKGCHEVKSWIPAYAQRCVIYSIDPSYKIKLEEKKERREEREERRAIRAMARADRVRQDYAPQSRGDSLSYAMAGMLGHAAAAGHGPNHADSVGKDGDILSECSSDDSDDDADTADKFEAFVSERLIGESAGMNPGQGATRQTRATHSSSFMDHDEVSKRLREFSDHRRVPVAYNLTDHNLRQYLDTYMRMCVTLSYDHTPGAVRFAVVKNFSFFLADEKTH